MEGGEGLQVKGGRHKAGEREGQSGPPPAGRGRSSHLQRSMKGGGKGGYGGGAGGATRVGKGGGKGRQGVVGGR